MKTNILLVIVILILLIANIYHFFEIDRMQEQIDFLRDQYWNMSSYMEKQ